LKKRLKILFLASSIVWLVFQSIGFISELGNKDFLSSPEPTRYIFNTCIDQIPLVYFAAIIAVLLTADLLSKKVKFENPLYIISAILFLPKMIVTSLGFNNISADSATQSAVQQLISYGMVIFELLILASILIFLIAKIFNIQKARGVNVVFFSSSFIAYIILTLLSFLSMRSIINNLIVAIIPTLIVFIVMLTAVAGIMLIKNNQSYPAKQA
jgi:hypothetical protein